MICPAISVLTTTWNRAHVLHRVYDSLTRQKTRDFEWVVVDDGSIDDTPSLLNHWQEEADFPIIWYRYANNRGRNAALNAGRSLVSGDYTLILDSDDALLEDALEVVSYWRIHSRIDSISQVSGMMFRCVNEAGSLVGAVNRVGTRKLPRELIRMTSKDARYRMRINFDFLVVLKTSVYRKYEFVELSDSEHCPEVVTFNLMANDFDMIYVDHPVRRYFTGDGIRRLSTAETKGLKWPRGNYLRALAVLNNDLAYMRHSPTVFLNAARKVTRLGLHIGRLPHRQFVDIRNNCGRLLWFIGGLGGIVGYIRDRLRGHTVQTANQNISAWGPAAAPKQAVLQPAPKRFGVNRDADKAEKEQHDTNLRD